MHTRAGESGDGARGVDEKNREKNLKKTRPREARAALLLYTLLSDTQKGGRIIVRGHFWECSARARVAVTP